MTTFTQGVLGGIIAVLTLDTIGSILSRRLNFRYARLSSVSLVLWALAGAIASRGRSGDIFTTVFIGGLAGLIVGLVDSTLGWWISWQIGPGRLRPERSKPPIIARTILTVTLFAGIFGTAGALLLRLL